MPITTSGIHYQTRGDGPMTVVMLPGLGCSIAAWSAVTPLLDGYRFVVMDLPGHAGSYDAPVDATSLAGVAAPLLDAIDELALEDFAVVGLSFGAAIGVQIALDRPAQVRAVVAFMPWNAGGAQQGDPFMQQMHDSYGDLDAVRRTIALISLDPTKTTDALTTMSTAVSAGFWRSWYGAGVFTSVAEELPRLTVPVCYVLGGRDVVAPRDELIDDVRAMPHGRLVLLAECGHLAPYEHPALVAQEIHEFLARHVRTGARLD